MREKILTGLLIALLMVSYSFWTGQRGHWQWPYNLYHNLTIKGGHWITVTDGTNSSVIYPDSIVTGVAVSDTIKESVVSGDFDITGDLNVEGQNITLKAGAITYIGHGATDSLRFYGPVGIGVDPGGGNLLYVDGNIRANSLYPALGSAAFPSQSFVGDANTGAWAPAADTWAVSTAGAERIRITSAGLVYKDGATLKDFLTLPLHTIAAGDSVIGKIINDAADTTLKYWDGAAWTSL